MKIGVDFDRVLFDTEKFKEYLNQNVEGLEHVDASPYNENDVYSPKIHAELCGIKEEDIYEVINNLNNLLYEDISALEDCEHEIIIVTRGLSKFQKAKVEATKAAEIAENLIIVEKGSKNVADIDFLIDDQKREIEEADIPGFEFDREKHTLDEALEEAERHAAR